MEKSMTTVVNIRGHKKKEHPDVVYVGRGYWGWGFSVYGNPFKVGVHGDNEEVTAKYRSWLKGDSHSEEEPERRLKILSRLHELRGRVLGCSCKPLPCHADVLAELADTI